MTKSFKTDAKSWIAGEAIVDNCLCHFISIKVNNMVIARVEISEYLYKQIREMELRGEPLQLNYFDLKSLN